VRSVTGFISYALEEYFFGIFMHDTGFGLYNLMMFIAMRKAVPLLCAYNLSIGLYEMCADGIAYHMYGPVRLCGP